MNRRTLWMISGAAVGAGLLLILAAFVTTGFRPEKFNTAEAVSETYEIAEPFTGLDIRVASSDVRFALSDDGSTRVESRHDTRMDETVEVRDGTLTIAQRDTSKWYMHIGFFYYGDESVTVYLAESELESLSVTTASGDIDVPEKLAFDRVKIDVTSGDVRFLAQCGEELTIGTVSGDIDAGGSTTLNVSASSTSGEITLANLTVADTLAIATVSGDVELKASGANDARLKTTSGEIELTDARITGKLSIHTVSGDVEFDRADAGELEIQTTSGEVEGTLLTGKTFDVHTTSGSVRVPESESGAGLCSVHTTSGDVSLRLY